MARKRRYLASSTQGLRRPCENAADLAGTITSLRAMHPPTAVRSLNLHEYFGSWTNSLKYDVLTPASYCLGTTTRIRLETQCYQSPIPGHKTDTQGTHYRVPIAQEWMLEQLCSELPLLALRVDTRQQFVALTDARHGRHEDEAGN